MLSVTRDRVDGTITRIRRSNHRVERGVDAVRRSQYRLHRIGGGGGAVPLPDLSRRSIMIVEENTDNLELFATFLRGCGAEVVAAACADVALESLRVRSVDVIMTDVSVLRMGGAGFIERVRRIPRHAGTPILAVTGWTERDVHPAECGFTAFMQKPVDLDRLGAELVRLTGAGAPVAGLA